MTARHHIADCQTLQKHQPHYTYAVCDVVSISDSDLTDGVFIPVDISDKAASGMCTLPDITMQATSSSVSPGISHQATNSSTLSTDAYQVSIVRPGNKFSAACFQVDCFLSEITSETVYNQPTSPCTSEHAISCSTLPGVDDQATRSSRLAVDHKHDNNNEVEEYHQIVDNGPNLFQTSDNEPKHFQIVDHESDYLHIVDHELDYLQIVENEPKYLQIVDHELDYLQIVDHEPKYLQIIENEIHCHKTIQVEPAYEEVVESGYQQITIVDDESHYHQIADNEPNYQQIESSDPGYEEITVNEHLNTSQAAHNTPANMPMDNHELHVTEPTHNNFINWIRNNKLVNS
jgi:hypothetical protein